MGDFTMAEFADIWEALLSMEGIDRKYHAGEMLYSQGDAHTGLFLIKTGIVKNSIFLKNGTEKSILIYEAPCVMGETAVIDQNTAINTTIAVTDTEAHILSPDRALEYIEAHPRAMKMLLRIYASKMRSVQVQAEITCYTIREKLARFLINAREFGLFLNNPSKMVIVTHEQLASFLGVSRPRITSMLNAFEHEGLIKKRSKGIEVLNMEGLYEILGE